MKMIQEMKYEANQWFRRNKDTILTREESYGAQVACDFFKEFGSSYDIENFKLLEIGACYGFNMNYWKGQLGIDVYGVEMSCEAVEYGQEKFAWGAFERGDVA